MLFLSRSVIIDYFTSLLKKVHKKLSTKEMHLDRVVTKLSRILLFFLVNQFKEFLASEFIVGRFHFPFSAFWFFTLSPLINSSLFQQYFHRNCRTISEILDLAIQNIFPTLFIQPHPFFLLSELAKRKEGLSYFQYF